MCWGRWRALVPHLPTGPLHAQACSTTLTNRPSACTGLLHNTHQRALYMHRPAPHTLTNRPSACTGMLHTLSPTVPLHAQACSTHSHQQSPCMHRPALHTLTNRSSACMGMLHTLTNRPSACTGMLHHTLPCCTHSAFSTYTFLIGQVLLVSLIQVNQRTKTNLFLGCLLEFKQH